MSLTGRTIVVTGAGRGLGRAFADGVAAGGAARVIVADINADWGQAAAAALAEVASHQVIYSPPRYHYA